MTESTEAGTRQTVLSLVVEKGPITSTTIAGILSLTTAAVRRHLTALQDSGDIVDHEVPVLKPRGRGRPARYYVATDAGRGRLDDHHDDLAIKAISYLGTVAGSVAIDSFAASRSREIERRYLPVVNEVGPDPRKRAQALADALSVDGYAASVRTVGGGDFAVQLCQGHCPIARVATEFPQLCEAETIAFGKILGVHVQRIATLAQGEHVCTMVIPVGQAGPRGARPVFRSGSKL